MEKKKYNYYLYTVMAVTAVILFFMMMHAQPCGTDWYRVGFRDRSPSGFLGLLGQQYQNVDGKVLGNLFSYLLMVPEWLRDLVKALFILGTIFVIWGMSKRKDTMSFLAYADPRRPHFLARESRPCERLQRSSIARKYSSFLDWNNEVGTY